MQQYALQYVQVAPRQKWPSFFFLFGETQTEDRMAADDGWRMELVRQSQIVQSVMFSYDAVISSYTSCTYQ